MTARKTRAMPTLAKTYLERAHALNVAAVALRDKVNESGPITRKTFGRTANELVTLAANMRTLAVELDKRERKTR